MQRSKLTPGSFRRFLRVGNALLTILFLASGCAGLVPALGPRANTRTTPTGDFSGVVVIMAASSLSGPFQELSRQFQTAHPDVQMRISFAGSQQLAQQLASGAPCDVFASANLKTMESAAASGRIDKTGEKIFARNRLVVILPKANPAGIKTLKDLSRSGLKLVMAAKEVPVGQYSLDFLDRAEKAADYGAGFKDAVLKNVVSYENNVKAVLTKVSLGEADAGIVYTSDAAGKGAENVAVLEIPETLNVVASYPIAVLKDSPNPAAAQAFMELVLSPAGQAVLEKYGLTPAGEASLGFDFYGKEFATEILGEMKMALRL